MKNMSPSDMVDFLIERTILETDEEIKDEFLQVSVFINTLVKLVTPKGTDADD